MSNKKFLSFTPNTLLPITHFPKVKERVVLYNALPKQETTTIERVVFLGNELYGIYVKEYDYYIVDINGCDPQTGEIVFLQTATRMSLAA